MTALVLCQKECTDSDVDQIFVLEKDHGEVATSRNNGIIRAKKSFITKGFKYLMNI